MDWPIIFLFQLHESFPKDIREKLEHDFQYYRISSKNEDKFLALYNYVLRLQDIFEEKSREFERQRKKLK